MHLCTMLCLYAVIIQSTLLMDTMLPSEEKGKNEFLIGVETARRVLTERVLELRTSVQKIEQELSAELDRLEKEHTEKQSEYTNKVSHLTAIRASIEDQFKSGDFEDLKNSVLSDTAKKMEALEREYPPHSVELVWEDRVGEQLKKIGSVVVSVGRREEKKEIKLDNYTPDSIPVTVDTSVEQTADIHTVTADTTDYKLRRKPVTTVPLPGCEFPHGITYDYMDNAVYIVDGLSWTLHTYSLETKKLQSADIVSSINFNFVNRIYIRVYVNLVSILGPTSPSRDELYWGGDDSYGNTKEIISPQPYAVLFHNNSLYISAKCRNIATLDFIVSFNILVNLEGKHLNKQHVRGLGNHGSVEGEMNTPTGIAFSEPNLYVCDSNNNRINVYSKDNSHYIIRTITHTFLYLPLDVKIHEKSIFVLNSRSPYVLEFDLTGYFLNEFLLDNGWDSNFMPSFFCIDSTGRFLISDKREPYIYVFNKLVYAKQALETRLELEHGEDRLVEPRGVCLDREGRVIVVCNYKNATLQIF